MAATGLHLSVTRWSYAINFFEWSCFIRSMSEFEDLMPFSRILIFIKKQESILKSRSRYGVDFQELIGSNNHKSSPSPSYWNNKFLFDLIFKFSRILIGQWLLSVVYCCNNSFFGVDIARLLSLKLTDVGVRAHGFASKHPSYSLRLLLILFFLARFLRF